MRYSLESNQRKYVKQYGFMSSARNFSNKYGNELMDTATKTSRQKKACKRELTKQPKQLEISLVIKLLARLLIQEAKNKKATQTSWKKRKK